MRNERASDTIAAIATPPGEGGIAIVRISGARAGAILRAAFRPAHKGEMKHGQMRYGTLTDSTGAPIDEVMAVFFHAPRSYTREDVAEIHLHGGTMCARAAMERLLSLGARAAEPGEFTYRAFMNGRVDLSEAEAIMGLIGARSQAARRASVRQLRGGVSAPIGRMREELTGLLAKIEAATDFPDEIDEDVTAHDVLEGAARIRDELARAADGRRARIVRDGASVVLCGRPNVGKSSLMNAILSADRAIVTDIPGTTRDVLTESFEIGGVRYQLSDTAGIRETADAIEKIGVDRARDALRDADCVLLVLDASAPLTPADQTMLAARDERYVTILNKCDLIATQEEVPPDPPAVRASGHPAATVALPSNAATCANGNLRASGHPVTAAASPSNAATCANGNLRASGHPGTTAALPSNAATCANGNLRASGHPGTAAALPSNAATCANGNLRASGHPVTAAASPSNAATCANGNLRASGYPVTAAASPSNAATCANGNLRASGHPGTAAALPSNAATCANGNLRASGHPGTAAALPSNAATCANGNLRASGHPVTAAASPSNAATCANGNLRASGYPGTTAALPSNAATCANAEFVVPTVKDPGAAAASIPYAPVRTSARTGAGVDEILRAIERICRQTGASEEPMILPRHIECAHKAMQALDRAVQAIQANQPLDLSASDLREALAHLGDITGETMDEHVIDRVFSDFCVGK